MKDLQAENIVAQRLMMAKTLILSTRLRLPQYQDLLPALQDFTLWGMDVEARKPNVVEGQVIHYWHLSSAQGS